jgi:hypothetical protein
VRVVVVVARVAVYNDWYVGGGGNSHGCRRRRLVLCVVVRYAAVQCSWISKIRFPSKEYLYDILKFVLI